MKGFKNIVKLFLMSAVIGSAVALVVCLYKLCAHHVIHFSHTIYSFLRQNLWLLPVVLAALFGISFLLTLIYKKHPNFKGGGVPNAVLSAQGKKKLSPIVDSIGAFVMSLFSFLLGLPLGNEGPCVQMGASISNGLGKAFFKDEESQKMAAASGTCAGFSAAVGGGLAGVFVCLEEIDRRPKFSLLFCTAVSSVVCAAIIRGICPVLGLSATIFPAVSLPKFSMGDIWIPIFVGVAFGLFSVVILKFYKALRCFFIKTLGKIPAQYKTFAVLVLCVVAGLVSFNFVSTGHELSMELFGATLPVLTLVLALIIRSVLTFSANSTGLTGGTFIPLIAISVTAGALLFSLCSSFIPSEYYGLVLVLSVCCAVSSVMKMPLVAITFTFETFVCTQYLGFIIVAAAVSYLLPALLKVESINEIVVEGK